ncbi:TraB/GumN family protein [Oxalicibacterium solurbis]|uniref:TraB/GumN family protein n=1 Tax=Oxalicibacterium solurbis TaxID=69280 RepID=A0A8J3B2R4_9BURK|nr:TraB/GumN family protein [Oxalicibacterium solurbis]GGI53835.1 hypothetical protein GCM10011430_10090 [Oxalicibacterium solurbis]
MRRFTDFVATLVVAILLQLASLYTASAHADAVHAPVSSAPQDAAKAPIPLRGTLYRVEHNGHTCYLFGTVHVGQAAFYPLEPIVMRALHASNTLAMEIDIRDENAFNQAIIKHGLYTDGTTIADHLTTDRLAKLKAALQQNGIPFERVARMKPWMIANLLIVQTMARNGYPTEQGLELYFLSVATKEGKIVRGLETPDYQLSLFNRLDDMQQQEYLEETLQDLNDGSEITQAIELIDAWRHADSAKMLALKQRMLNDGSASSQFIEDILLNQRNPGLADRIAMLLNDDKTSFVAVGMLHLIDGENSIPALLQKRGYQVRKLY